MKPKRAKRKLQVDPQVIIPLTPEQNQQVQGGAGGPDIHVNGVKVSRCCL